MFISSKIERAASEAACYGCEERQTRALAQELRNRGIEPETVWSQALTALIKANAAIEAERTPVCPDGFRRQFSAAHYA